MATFYKEYLNTVSPLFNYEPVQNLTKTFTIRKQIITSESDNLRNELVTFN